MRRRWLMSAGVCALTVLAIRGWAARPAKAATISHVAEFISGDLRTEVSAAQQRYMHSQPHHWRQLVGQQVSR